MFRRPNPQPTGTLATAEPCRPRHSGCHLLFCLSGTSQSFLTFRDNHLGRTSAWPPPVVFRNIPLSWTPWLLFVLNISNDCLSKFRGKRSSERDLPLVRWRVADLRGLE
jgi:hypothetical protein